MILVEIQLPKLRVDCVSVSEKNFPNEISFRRPVKVRCGSFNPVVTNFDKIRVHSTLSPSRFFYFRFTTLLIEFNFIRCARLIQIEGERDAISIFFSYYRRELV